MIRITVLPKQTFRGAYHYREVTYDASDNLAAHAVKEGIAKFSEKDWEQSLTALLKA